MAKSESVLHWLGLPVEFGVALLIAALALSLAPYLAGSDFGLVKVPSFAAPIRARLRFIGPVVLFVAIFLHLPIIRPAPVSITPASPQAERITLADQPILRKQPSAATATTDSEDPSAILTPIVRARPVPSTWRIHLQIPSAMSAGEILVDGHPARVLRRAGTVITVEIPAGPQSHEFRVEAPGRPACVVSQLTLENNLTLTPCQP